jgi:hypothetical protein
VSTCSPRPHAEVRHGIEPCATRLRLVSLPSALTHQTGTGGRIRTSADAVLETAALPLSYTDKLAPIPGAAPGARRLTAGSVHWLGRWDWRGDGESNPDLLGGNQRQFPNDNRRMAPSTRIEREPPDLQTGVQADYTNWAFWWRGRARAGNLPRVNGRWPWIRTRNDRLMRPT